MARTRAPGNEERSTRAPRRAGGWVALTGTPGTGKSAVGRLLPSGDKVTELRALALMLGSGRRTGRGREVEVNLPALRRGFRSFLRRHPDGVVVGHLAHFLPVSYVIVLRCHPLELIRRLRRARRRSRDRRENALSEALDVVLVEALTLGVPVREVDTTGRSVASVAREVARIVRRRPASRYGRVHWLSDRRVTAELLRPAG